MVRTSSAREVHTPQLQSDTQSRTSQQTDYPGETSAPGAADPPPRVGVDPKAPFWAIYNKEAASSDRETTRGWTGSLDLLLIVVSSINFIKILTQLNSSMFRLAYFLP